MTLFICSFILAVFVEIKPLLNHVGVNKRMFDAEEEEGRETVNTSCKVKENKLKLRMVYKRILTAAQSKIKNEGGFDY